MMTTPILGLNEPVTRTMKPLMAGFANDDEITNTIVPLIQVTMMDHKVLRPSAPRTFSRVIGSSNPPIKVRAINCLRIVKTFGDRSRTNLTSTLARAKPRRVSFVRPDKEDVAALGTRFFDWTTTPIWIRASRSHPYPYFPEVPWHHYNGEA